MFPWIIFGVLIGFLIYFSKRSGGDPNKIEWWF